MRGWLRAVLCFFRQPAPPCHLGVDLVHLFAHRRQHAAFAFDKGIEGGVLRGARSFPRRLFLRAIACQRRNDVRRVDAGLHPACDVGADPQMRVVADPHARVDARGAGILWHKQISSRRPAADESLQACPIGRRSGQQPVTDVCIASVGRGDPYAHLDLQALPRWRAIERRDGSPPLPVNGAGTDPLAGTTWRVSAPPFAPRRAARSCGRRVRASATPAARALARAMLMSSPASIARHSASAASRSRDSFGAASFTALTRAPLSSGKVTMEISHRSTWYSRRTRLFGSIWPRTVR